MVIHRPPTLANKLTRVFRSGYTNVDEIAHDCGLSPQLIEAAARGTARIDRDTEFRITKALARHYRKHIHLYRELGPPTRGGVFERDTGCSCRRGFVLRDPHGKICRYIEIPSEECSQAEIDKLWRWLERRYPVAKVI